MKTITTFILLLCSFVLQTTFAGTVSLTSERLRTSGADSNEPLSASLTLVFHFEPTEEISIHLGDQSVEVTPTPVMRLADTVVPKVTVSEASLMDQYEKPDPRTFPLVPNLKQTVLPLEGSVLYVNLHVVPEDSNVTGTGNQF